MNIINSNLDFRGGISYGNNPKMVILHQADASKCSINDIHQWHLNRGWSGCGYHFFVRKDGTIYKGRDEKAVGAHCLGYNAVSIGICAEGNFNNETMGEAQYNSLLELIRSICSKYGINRICGHRELNPTDCPGKNYPLDKIKAAVKGEEVSARTSYPGYLIRMKPNVFDEDVRLIQKKLIGKGYSVGSCGADGYFGTATLNAVKMFQRDSGLAVDGIVGVNTWRKLMEG